MAKKIPSMTPPARELTTEQRAFVKELGTTTPKPAAAPAPKQGAVRRVSVYFPLELARRLKVTCAERDEDMSGFIVRVVEAALRE